MNLHSEEVRYVPAKIAGGLSNVVGQHFQTIEISREEVFLFDQVFDSCFLRLSYRNANVVRPFEQDSLRMKNRSFDFKKFVPSSDLCNENYGVYSLDIALAKVVSSLGSRMHSRHIRKLLMAVRDYIKLSYSHTVTSYPSKSRSTRGSSYSL